MGGFWTTRAARLAHVVCYTSPDSYVAAMRNARTMPIGIDTELFRPVANRPRGGTILMLGRMDRVKNPDLLVRGLLELTDAGKVFHADLVGDPTNKDSSYAREVKQLAEPLVEQGRVSFLPSVRNAETPALYAAHSLFVNLTPSGSFDKTIGEAMACGTLVVCANMAVAEIVPPRLLVDDLSADRVQETIEAALALPDADYHALTRRMRAFIEEKHSLRLLTKKLVEVLHH